MIVFNALNKSVVDIVFTSSPMAAPLATMCAMLSRCSPNKEMPTIGMTDHLMDTVSSTMSYKSFGFGMT
jgi:hypothetical protein